MSEKKDAWPEGGSNAHACDVNDKSARESSLTTHSPSFVDQDLGEHRTDLLLTLRSASGRTDTVESILATLQEQKSTDVGNEMISLTEEVRRDGKAASMLQCYV
jgi:hypothetical protein